MKPGKLHIVENNQLLAKPKKSGPHYPTTIRTCDCSNPFQDLQYGLKKRVHNSRMANKELTYSCTSCGKGSRAPNVSAFKVGQARPNYFANRR